MTVGSIEVNAFALLANRRKSKHGGRLGGLGHSEDFLRNRQMLI
jgi:hypothetical protein